ncbi:MAG: catalase [Cyanobacteria bacterium P01_F01_bin.150]
MQLFTEYPERNEHKYYKKVTTVTRKRMDDLYGNTSKALRDTHAKTQAAVKASLEIFDFNEEQIKQAIAQCSSLSLNKLEDISLKQGLLAQAKTYPVWLRFANGRTSVENDYEPDTRSMSVKVIGVEGDRLFQSHEQHTQDLIVQNAEIFFIESIRSYYGFFSSVARSKLFALLWLLLHPKQRKALKKITSRTPQSLLTEKYWSGSASALGLPANFDPSKPGVTPVTYPLVVKYAFIPVSPQSPHTPLAEEVRSPDDLTQAQESGKKGKPDNYYQTEMSKALVRPDAEYCWDFQIQVQTVPVHSIDNVTVVWPETEAPFFTVGRMTVKHQTIDNPSQLEFAENLQFSPWNGLEVHRPVGALNRLRGLVYPLVGNYRHQNRGVNYREPTGNETF